MTIYDFGPRIPNLLIFPISCKYDKRHPYDNRVHNLDNTYAECFSGKKWCRVCGQEQDPLVTEDKCVSCELAHWGKNFIPSRLVHIQSAYAELLDSEQVVPTNFSKHKGGMRAWLEATVLRQQCKATFSRMAYVLRSIFPICPGSPIKQIVEFEYQSRNWNHCAFLFLTEYGDYVFDPTGKQFGPSWPIFVKLKDYEWRIEKCLWYAEAGTWGWRQWRYMLWRQWRYMLWRQWRYMLWRQWSYMLWRKRFALQVAFART